MSESVNMPETRKIFLSVNDSPTMNGDLWGWLYSRGVIQVRAHSTAKALEFMSRCQFDGVISNLRRVENGCQNPQAGIELVQNLRRIHSSLPIAIYTMSVDQAMRNAALHAGANLITVSPDELKQWLVTFIGV